MGAMNVANVTAFPRESPFPQVLSFHALWKIDKW
jgi:hypothetical protein